jgi:hypothetical protein
MHVYTRLSAHEVRLSLSFLHIPRTSIQSNPVGHSQRNIFARSRRATDSHYERLLTPDVAVFDLPTAKPSSTTLVIGVDSTDPWD